jgi:hypothetical protein
LRKNELCWQVQAGDKVLLDHLKTLLAREKPPPQVKAGDSLSLEKLCQAFFSPFKQHWDEGFFIFTHND